MVTRQDVERAVAGQDPETHLMICNGEGQLLAERPGTGHSAALLVLDDGDLEQSVRPNVSPRPRRNRSPPGTSSAGQGNSGPSETPTLPDRETAP